MSTRIPQHVLAYLTAQPWAMHAPTLERVARVVCREDLEAVLPPADWQPSAAITRTFGEPHDVAQATVLDGVATLAVHGPLMRYADFFTMLCGGATYEQLGADLGTLMDDAAVQAVILDIDSPGGEVNGCAELAALIAGFRGTKPLVAHISGLGCSAAYWLAAACDEIVVAPTAIVGSLGVRFVQIDTSEQQAREGVREISIVSSQTPGKAHDDMSTPDGLAATQRVADSLALVFLEQVAELRGVTIDALLRGTRDGGTVVGAEAVAGQLATRVGTAESLHAELVTGARMAPAPSSRSPRMSQRTGAGRSPQAALYTPEQQVRALVARDVMIAEGATGTVREVVENVVVYAVDFGDGEYRWIAEQELAAVDAAAGDAPADPAAPAAQYRSIRGSLIAQATLAERERILAIGKLATPATASVAQQAIADGCSVEEAAHRLLLATPKADADRLARLRADEQAAAQVRSSVPAAPTGDAAIASRILSAGRGSASTK